MKWLPWKKETLPGRGFARGSARLAWLDFQPVRHIIRLLDLEGSRKIASLMRLYEMGIQDGWHRVS
jgi:hypothetical protein